MSTDTPMDERTLSALKGSIEKWEGIVAGTDVDRGTDNCPLCASFNPFIDGSANRGSAMTTCLGCPVRERTGKSFCEGTPYDEFDPNETFDTDKILKPGTEEYKAAAQRELDFLCSLLPVTP